MITAPSNGLKLRFAALLLSLVCTADQAYAGSLKTLMTDLAKVEIRHARFVEERTLGVLDEPLITEGTLFYEAPDRLIRQDLLPDAAIYEIRGNQLQVIIDGKEKSLALDQEPMLAALVLPFRAMFAGDLDALETLFDAAYAENDKGWSVTLTPKPSSPTRQFLDHIEITGKDQEVERMDVHEQGGDLSSMVLEAIVDPIAQ